MVHALTMCLLHADSSQVMKWCLESKRAEFGAVSALCFNRDATRLLVGFANGQVSQSMQVYYCS